MNFEELQKAWQSQDSGAVTVDADALLRKSDATSATSARPVLRDVREVGVALLLAVFFLVWGIRVGLVDCLLSLAFWRWRLPGGRPGFNTEATRHAGLSSGLHEISFHGQPPDLAS